MVFERSEDIADGEMHLSRRLDVLEDNEAAILEYVIELPTNRVVLERLKVHAADARAERKV